MTREQLIREMIQIELLYQTRQKLLKENTQASASYPIMVGSNSSNNFINTECGNDSVVLNNEYKKNNRQLTITDLQYKTGAVSSIKIKDIDIVWDYLEKKLHEKLDIPNAALGKIVDILKAADRNLGQNVFSIFNTEFPLQSLDFGSGLKDVAAAINTNITNPLYVEIFKNKSKDENQTFNSGKGEFLTVLLVKDAKSGGTKKLDVVVNNKQFDVKQISQHSAAAAKSTKAAKNKSTQTAAETVQQLSTQTEEEKLLPANYLALTLSEKSGLRNPKNKFVNAQAKLGQKLSQLTSELEKLNVDDKLINKLKTQEGYTSSAFRRSSTDSDEDPNKYLSFTDMSDIIKQGLTGLRANTYINIKQLSDFKTNVFKAHNSIVSGPNYLNNDVIEFFKDCYNLELTSFNQIKDIDEISKLLVEVKNDDKILFKKFNTNAYNKLIDDNIDNKYANFFKINNSYAPISDLIIHSKIKPEDFDIFRNNFEMLREFNTFFSNNKTNFIASNKPGSYGNVNDKPDTQPDTFRTTVYDVLNKQIILTINQMKKINSIIQKNDTIQLNNNQKISGVNNNTVIGDNYFVAEPLQPTENDGEFIIDISYYENMKKKHVDTLYSQDFKIEQNNDLEKTDKAAAIVNKANDKKEKIKNVTIDLKNVISDRDTINNKLKNFQLFDNLQPSVLKNLFNHDRSDKDFLSKDFIKNNLKDIKDKTKEDNILNIIYEMYFCCDLIEKEIKKYYIEENSILIYKDDGSSQGGTSTPRAAYTWESVIENLENKNIDSFIMQIGHEQILCYSDNTVPDNLDNNFNSVKNLIKKLFNEVMELMLDLQSITSK
jgi:hypothetical protein